MLPCVFVLVGLGLQLPNPGLTRKRKGITSLSAFRPDTARWSHGQTGPAHLQRGLTTGSRGREAANTPLCGGPALALPSWGDGAGSGKPVVPGPQRRSSPALRPRKRKDTSRAAEETQGGSVPRASPWEPNRRRTPSPSAPFPGPVLGRLYAASAGPAEAPTARRPWCERGRAAARNQPATPIPHPPPQTPVRLRAQPGPRTLASPPAAPKLL